MHLLDVGPSALWALVAGAFITVLLAAGSFVQIARVFKVALCGAAGVRGAALSHPHPVADRGVGHRGAAAALMCSPAWRFQIS
jgi:hypothetical protein